MIVRLVVDQQHLAAGSDHIAQQLAVIPVARQHIGDVHPRLDSGQAQYIRRVIEGVALQVGGRAPGMRDRRVESVCRARRRAGRHTEYPASK